jgi:hypothetical protein
MTSDVKQHALAVLADVWALSPNVRLGQLFAHLGFLGEAQIGRGLGDIEDDELMAILQRHRTELVARSEGVPDSVPKQAGTATSLSGSESVTLPRRMANNATETVEKPRLLRAGSPRLRHPEQADDFAMDMTEES